LNAYKDTPTDYIAKQPSAVYLGGLRELV